MALFKETNDWPMSQLDTPQDISQGALSGRNGVVCPAKAENGTLYLADEDVAPLL